MERMLEQIEKEIKQIGNVGLSTSNIDRAYKLIDMYANMRDACYKKTKEQTMKGEGIVAPASKMGETDNLYNDYIDAKKNYRYTQTSECKRKLIRALDDYMDSFTRHLETMMKDAECADERDMIERYMSKIKSFT